MNDEQMKEFLQMVAEKLREEDGGPQNVLPITAKDILLDFKLFANDVYEGKAEGEDEESLIVIFQNGQKFRIIVKEIKLQLLE